MSLNQDLIDAHNANQDALIANADWFPSNTVKLLAYIHAYQLDLALKPSLISHGGSQAEEIRWNVEITQNELWRLQNLYTALNNRTSNTRGGFRQTQLSRCIQRW